MKYYRLIPNGNDKEGGLLYPPQEWPYPIARDAVEVENWQNLKVELKEGIISVPLKSGSFVVTS